ncbi:hypothetical protein [Anaerotignum sp. MB30-C6]|uniref:hypothetical protein n=1 Tax=Anaerotignum sp. MB30-C6 TaxID=3070814 RepID=UPI0027DD38B6|nr:hypothetical protein [Anaerotignum sp. MB30-C6]WMI80947.1 hypothetical protein RBQ60_14170 [Anaerotignum sp. MB30-C6]
MKKAKPDKRLPALVKSKMYERGIKGEEMATYLHMCPGTYYRRMNNPEEFTIANLKVFCNKLKIDKATLVEAML